MKESFMTEKQKKVIQRLFKMGKTYHALADESGVGKRPDKFEDLSYDMAQQIIKAQSGLLGLKR